MLLVEAADGAAAEALVGGDPFCRQGAFERVELRPRRAVRATWAG